MLTKVSPTAKPAPDVDVLALPPEPAVTVSERPACDPQERVRHRRLMIAAAEAQRLKRGEIP